MAETAWTGRAIAGDMALRGNLKDFSLPDVFQLVQLSKKTGVLRIKRSDAEGSIWFRDGEVFFAQSDWHREPLGQRLVNAGRITPSALAKAMEIRAREPEGGRRLGQILVDEGYITQPVLEAFVQEQIQDTIFDLMRWDEGDFNFEILPEVVEEDIGLSVSVENIVMEGSRRIEEWNRIKKKVPSMDMVFKMATAPGEGTFEISLKPTEWNLLLLTDGTRTVGELARSLGKTDFEVARVIYGLFSAGLLEVAADDEVERLRAERAEREARRAERAAAAPPPAPAPVGAQAPVRPEVSAAEPETVEEVEEETPEVAPVAEPAVPSVPREPVEEPEFLAAPKAAPSADDMAVFEQVMGAVLKPQPEPSAHATPLSAPEAEPVSAQAPEAVPAVEVAPISEAELSEIPVAPVLEALPEEPAPVPQVPTEAPAFVPTGDLEKDLLALGLGELPPEAATLEEERTGVEAVEAVQQVEEPEAHAVPAAIEPLGVREPERPAVEQVSTDAALSDLLKSLGGEEEVSGPEEREAPKVISTDAFLAEFETDVTLSSALTDEITALTGGGSGRPRPTTTVSKLPEPGEAPALRRDQLVDRDLVLKIIDGIEKL
ncbi:MAG: DUF4388 domain-containing protein [Coriobacteriia bacterium]|nr:DUF4388 domain-containing protein [Coriobacteriia bacterium]